MAERQRVAWRALVQATEAVARAIAALGGPASQVRIGDCMYSLDLVTWPVAERGRRAEAVPCPEPKMALLQDDAVLSDVRVPYVEEGRCYRPIGHSLGVWSAVSKYSGRHAYFLHVASPEERERFAGEAARVVEAFTELLGKRAEGYCAAAERALSALSAMAMPE